MREIVGAQLSHIGYSIYVLEANVYRSFTMGNQWVIIQASDTSVDNDWNFESWQQEVEKGH